MKKPATKQEKEFMMRVKQLNCVVCNAPPPSEFHHIVSGYRLGHMWGLPLCTGCHRGDNGFSGNNRGAWDKSLDNQLKLMAVVYKQLNLEIPHRVNKIVPRRLDY